MIWETSLRILDKVCIGFGSVGVIGLEVGVAGLEVDVVLGRLDGLALEGAIVAVDV